MMELIILTCSVQGFLKRGYEIPPPPKKSLHFQTRGGGGGGQDQCDRNSNKQSGEKNHFKTWGPIRRLTRKTKRCFHFKSGGGGGGGCKPHPLLHRTII